MARVLFKTEYDLARALVRCDAHAQRAFYEKYASRFLGVCCRYIQDRMAAEDVMVESFMRIFEKCSQFDYKGSFEGWSKRIVVNEALTYLRREKFEWNEIQDLEAETTGSLEVEDLLALIHNLPVGYRTVFNLYAVEGYTHAEISEMLSISVGTSKSQLSRARNILQAQIKKNEEALNF